MSLVRIDRNPSDRTLRQFAVSWFILAIMASLLLYYNAGWISVGAVLIALGLILLVFGWIKPQAIRVFFVAWMVGLYPVNYVMSHLILFSLFYGLFTPIGILLRILGKDPLHRNWDPKAETYWQAHSPPAKKSQYFRQF